MCFVHVETLFLRACPNEIALAETVSEAPIDMKPHTCSIHVTTIRSFWSKGAPNLWY